MKKYSTISIVIPTYNEESVIEQCLNSIISKKYPGKIEIIIVDAGSSDNTVKLAKQYNIILLHNPQKHAEVGKMIGLKASTGDYFMILDCDMSLIGDNWFTHMLEPLEKDKSIIGSFTGFVSKKNDMPMDRYITLDPIQRDPLFSFLTPSIQSLIIKKNINYSVLQYTNSSMIPAGFCLYRMKEIRNNLLKNSKYMELDIIARFVKNNKSLFAYVKHIGIHHPFLGTFSQLIHKRERNLKTMYFNQPEDRDWTWIDWNSLEGKLKIVWWIIWVYSIIPSLIVGVKKCITFKTWVGLYELPFNIIMTTTVIKVFLLQKQGRNFLYNN